jgi:hypothetical protein
MPLPSVWCDACGNTEAAACQVNVAQRSVASTGQALAVEAADSQSRREVLSMGMWMGSVLQWLEMMNEVPRKEEQERRSQPGE